MVFLRPLLPQSLLLLLLLLLCLPCHPGHSACCLLQHLHMGPVMITLTSHNGLLSQHRLKTWSC